MEYEIKTIVCPNCGANTTNHQNCEYCGSMLVRCYEMMGINEDGNEEDEKEVLKLFGKSAYTNEDLCDKVKKIIDLSAKYKTEIRGDVYSYVKEHQRINKHEPYENILTIISDNHRDTLTLIIKFNMENTYRNRDFGDFEDESFSKLFTIEQEGSIMLCSMEIDKNEKTAAKFIKYIVEELFCWRENKYECRIFGIINGETKEFVPKHLIDNIKKLNKDKESLRPYIRIRRTCVISAIATLGIGLLLTVTSLWVIGVVCMILFLIVLFIVGWAQCKVENLNKSINNYKVSTALIKYRYMMFSGDLLSEE